MHGIVWPYWRGREELDLFCEAQLKSWWAGAERVGSLTGWADSLRVVC